MPLQNILITLEHSPLVSSVSFWYMTSSAGTIIPQSMTILPLKHFARLLWKRETIVLPTAWGSCYTVALQWIIFTLCMFFFLLVCTDGAESGDRKPLRKATKHPQSPSGPLQGPWPQGQETLHLSQYNSSTLGPVEYGPVWLFMFPQQVTTYQLASACGLVFMSLSEMLFVYVWLEAFHTASCAVI